MQAASPVLGPKQGQGGGGKPGTAYPKSFLLLRGWLDSCFVGWLPEHSATFLWDQLVLSEGGVKTYRSLLPRICCCLLELLRDDLLAAVAGSDFVAILQRSGRRLKTAIVVNAFKGIVSVAQIEADLLIQIRDAAMVVVERMVRGYLARRRVRKIKVQRSIDERRADVQERLRREQLMGKRE